MSPTYRAAGPPLTIHRIRAAQLHAGLELTRSYIDFLLDTNGRAYPEGAFCPVLAREIRWLFPLGEVQARFRRLHGLFGLPRYLVPVGEVLPDRTLFICTAAAARSHVFAMRWGVADEGCPSALGNAEVEDPRYLGTLEFDHLVSRDFRSWVDGLLPEDPAIEDALADLSWIDWGGDET